MSETTARTTTSAATAPITGGATQGAALPPRPWIKDGIDYGPAWLYLDELIAWAFDLAAQSVTDSPADRRRVKNAQRFVRASMHGKRPRSCPYEDVSFTAALLVRIFDADLELGLGEIVTILDGLGLPTEDATVTPRSQPTPAPRHCAPEAPSPTCTAMDAAIEHLVAILGSLTPQEDRAARAVLERMAPPDRAALVGDMLRLSVDDAAACIRVGLNARPVAPFGVGRTQESRVAPATCATCGAVPDFRCAA